LQAFFENSPNSVFLKDRQGRYLHVNKEFKRAFRITEEQIKGKRDDEIFSLEQASSFQTNDRQVLETGDPMEFEEVAVQEDGPHTSIVHKFPLLDAEGKIYAIGGIVTDITGRKRAEKELLDLRDELAAELTAMTRLHEFSTHLLAIHEFQPVLEEVLEATIALQNADFGNIQLYNPETQALEIIAQRGFQQDFLDYLGNTHDIGIACGRALKLRERVIIEDVETDFEYAPHRHACAAAGFRAVQSTPLFSRSGELLGMLSTHFRWPHRPSQRNLWFTDLHATHAAEIIERERLEAARRDAQQALQMMQVELARVSRLTTMGELAASIAHEVNQPLAAVTNNSSACLRLLAEGNLKPEVLRRALEEIVADGTRASAVIARIRAFIKKAPTEMNELDLNELIEEVLALSGRELSGNRVLLERQLTKALPLVVGDRVQLQQVLRNLIMNGIEAMTAVTDRPRLLSVKSGIDEPGNVLVVVRDSGTGLGLEADRVFTPFFTTKANGMGLGLSISRSLIEAHGGQLWAAPNSPHGAMFYFTLPVGAGNPL
jgi:PAS domain S-box-containing protein